MDIRHTVIKSFGEGVEIRRYAVLDNIPFNVMLQGEKKDPTIVNVLINENDGQDTEIHDAIYAGKLEVLANGFKDCVTEEGHILPLSQMFDYKPDLSVDDTNLNEVASRMFPEVDTRTGLLDVSVGYVYSQYIPLAILTGAMTAQTLDDKSYFNPNGCVSIAEFLDGLNAIKYGANANSRRKKTLDNISNTNDYFNEGYQECCRGISSPLFNLYRRDELVKPITRWELAYITVLCWKRFMEKYNAIYGGAYYLGINFDWENPYERTSKFKDITNFNISKVILDVELDITSLNIKDYMGGRTLTEYKEDIKDGISPLPLPVLMSMLELDILGAYPYTLGELQPLREVTRGELAYFLTKIAELFPTKFVK